MVSLAEEPEENMTKATRTPGSAQSGCFWGVTVETEVNPGLLFTLLLISPPEPARSSSVPPNSPAETAGPETEAFNSLLVGRHVEAASNFP